MEDVWIDDERLEYDRSEKDHYDPQVHHAEGERKFFSGYHSSHKHIDGGGFDKNGSTIAGTAFLHKIFIHPIQDTLTRTSRAPVGKSTDDSDMSIVP